ncbi:RPF2-like protein [Mya arenaria]|uniref:Ribosome production factor 2 homolog n=1 Tax=Mya arenaria TaxID=6604 RepID=A0ABY7EE07_MYAAR|nr:RPF2-like protein [Mya arenaria]
MALQRVVKPKTQRGKRFLESREPKIFENTKQCMFVKGGNTSQTVTQLLKEFCQLKKTHSVMYKRKNILRPFEDETPLKSDASLFMFGSHSKKRPNNIVLGRLFDHHILDMIELGIDSFKSMSEFEGPKCPVGTKPCLMFAGEQFDTDPELKRLKNMLIDFFRGEVVKNIRLQGLEHVVMVTVVDGKILVRNYRIILKKSGSRVPRVELDEMGPSVDFSVRRTKIASDDLYKRALKKPKTSTIKKRKNISKDAFGSQLGRVHMQKQDLANLQTRKMKALKRKPAAKGDDQEGGGKRAKSDDETVNT